MGGRVKSTSEPNGGHIASAQRTPDGAGVIDAESTGAGATAVDIPLAAPAVAEQKKRRGRPKKTADTAVLGGGHRAPGSTRPQQGIADAAVPGGSQRSSSVSSDARLVSGDVTGHGYNLRRRN